MKKYISCQSPAGLLYIADEGGAITNIEFDRRFKPPADWENAGTPLTRRMEEELGEYFAGKRREFDLPLAPRGTAFQLSVWEELRRIPYGETRAYGDLAKNIGNPKACRAVGMANNRNPISIVIPCHRVIGAGGALVGYGGGLDIKALLLDLEKGDA